jgi:predicted RNase H-like HicB family nuclease
MQVLRRGGSHVRQEYTAVIKQDSGWWIGWIEELPGVNCQETSREELLVSLRVTLKEALELNRQEALQAAGVGFEEAPINDHLARKICRDLGVPRP